VSRDFLLLVLFMNQFPPSPRVFQEDHFKFFRKFAVIFTVQGLPPGSTTPVANGKNLQSEKFLIILFGHLWVVEETYTVYKFLSSSSLSGVSSLILFPLFAPGVNDTGGKFTEGVVDTGGNLPPALLTPAANLPPVSLTLVANLPTVSTTQGELVAKIAAGVVDTDGYFAAGVVDTAGKFATGVVDTGGAP
jgi:hypothetical protein